MLLLKKLSPSNKKLSSALRIAASALLLWQLLSSASNGKSTTHSQYCWDGVGGPQASTSLDQASCAEA